MYVCTVPGTLVGIQLFDFFCFFVIVVAAFTLNSIDTPVSYYKHRIETIIKTSIEPTLMHCVLNSK